jgi:YVTN family beta-propeller protein
LLQLTRHQLLKSIRMNKWILLTLGCAILVGSVACSQMRYLTPSVANGALAAHSTLVAVPESGFIYTANERGKSISVIDLRSGHVTTIPTSISPHNVQISRDGRFLLAVGEVPEELGKGPFIQGKKTEMDGMKLGRLLIFNAEKIGTESPVEIEVGPEPAHVVVAAQDKSAYVTNSMGDNLSVVDLEEKKVVDTIATGKMPHGLRPSPNGREIYVADVNGNAVSVIDVGQSKEVARIPTGRTPVQVAFTPDGRFAYTSLRDENRVAVIDTVQRKLIATVAVGRNPIQLYPTPDGRRIYVANQGTEANPDNTVSVIDTTSNTVVATILTGRGAHGVMISSDGRRVFVSNIQDDSVSVVDVATNTVINTIKVGRGPNGITFRSAN